jgi:hypothetical protein
VSMEFFFERYYNFYNSRAWRDRPEEFYAEKIRLVVNPLVPVQIDGNRNLVNIYNMTLEFAEDKVEFEKARIFGDGNSFAVEVPMTYHLRKEPTDQAMKDTLAQIGLVPGAAACRVQYFMHYDLNRSGQFTRIAVGVSGQQRI